MTQVTLSAGAEVHSAGALLARIRRSLPVTLASDAVRGVAMAGIGLAIIGVATTGVLFASQWQGLPAPVIPPGQIQHR